MALGARGRAVSPGQVEVPPCRRPVVAGDPARAPAQVVRGADVGEKVEALRVAQVDAGLDQSGRVDDQGRLAVLLFRLDQSGDALKGQEATPRISYAGGTPAWIFSWSRTMPSSSASGRGGQPGTWISTGQILSTPCRTA
jgi:hypothetical protein